jgi:hypothetical protein
MRALLCNIPDLNDERDFGQLPMIAAILAFSRQMLGDSCNCSLKTPSAAIGPRPDIGRYHEMLRPQEETIP